jgi:TRAP transporter TAXI family solute receptor
MSFQLQQWLKIVLVGLVVALATGAGVFGYRYFTRPVTLTVAAGSVDGYAAQIMSSIATRLTETNSPVRLKVVSVDSAFDAAKTFSAGKVDLAIIRADIGDLSEVRTVVLMTHAVVMILVPPGSSIDSIDALKGQTVGVVGGEANHPVVDAIKQEYDLANKKVMFKDLALADVPQALHSKQVTAVLFVAPVTEKYLSIIRAAFQGYGKKTPTPIAIEDAGAIASVAGAYESYDLPKGTLWGSPPVPDDDLTTLRVPFYLVANKKLDDNVVANLTRAIMNARRELVAEFPLLAQISSPSTDKDAYIPMHPGAAEYYGDTQQGFLDKYSNELYYGPMALGAIMSGLIAAWKYLGLGGTGRIGSPLDPLYALARRIRVSNTEAELIEIEDEIDNILKAELARTAKGDETAVDPGILSLAAHRLENLIHYRRTILAAMAH